MLKTIRIRNFAIVEEISIDLSEGLNLLTGETGAGKSIIVDALEILLGERSTASVIRTGEEKATVEGLFSMEELQDAERILERAGIAGSDELVLKREINATGSGKIHINGEIASLSTLKQIGNILVDIHGQHQHQSLLHAANHLSILDHFGENGSLLSEVSELSGRLAAQGGEYGNLKEALADRERKVDFLGFQLAEIERVSAKPGEDERLSQERDILKNAEALKKIVSGIYTTLYEDEGSILHSLKQVRQSLEKLCGIDSGPSRFLPTLDETRYSLEDLSLYLRDYLKKPDDDPEKLIEVEDRLAGIERLKKKYGGSIESIEAFRSRAASELEKLKNSEEDLDSLRKSMDELYRKYRAGALQLSRKRKEGAERFSRAVAAELGDMAMGGCRFSVKLESDPLPEAFEPPGDPLPGGLGMDRAEFLISLNVGEELRPLARVASGGELSRIMLAINHVLERKDSSKTLIFDEVDAGIGAGVASAVGQKLKTISKRNQVICITHLPQIASLADHHLSVRKKVAKGRTTVEVRRLDDKEKVKEIARMLAGEKISAASLIHAEEMIKNEKGKGPEIKGRLSRNV